MQRKKLPSFLVPALLALSLALTGCQTLGPAAADLGLAGAGGVAGYHLADEKVGGAAAVAALGYLGSRLAQNEVDRKTTEAERRGHERGLNQAVKQQYWIIQARQRTAGDSVREPNLIPVVIPETNVNGVIQRAHVEYLRVP